MSASIIGEQETFLVTALRSSTEYRDDTPVSWPPSPSVELLKGFSFCAVMNTFSEIDLIRMSDFDFLATIRAWPMESKWSDKKAFAYGLSRLTHMNGVRYAQTGNTKAFTKSMR